MWEPNTPALRTAETASGRFTPILWARGMTMGRAMMYMPQLVPVMNSVKDRARKMISGMNAGVTRPVAVLMTYSVKWISRFTRANRKARTMSSRGRIMLLKPSMQTSTNSSASSRPCTR